MLLVWAAIQLSQVFGIWSLGLAATIQILQVFNVGAANLFRAHGVGVRGWEVHGVGARAIRFEPESKSGISYLVAKPA